MKLNLSRRCMDVGILLIVFTSLLFIGAGNILNHKISHPFPWGYQANDNFLHYGFAQALADNGDYENPPAYLYAGFEDIIGFNPPILLHLSVVLSQLSGIAVYDTIYFLAFFFATFSVILYYLIIKEWNKDIALLSLPLTSLIFVFPFLAGIAWGQWDFYVGHFFLLASIWAVINLDLRKSFLLIALLFSATLIAHVVEFAYILLFILILLSMEIIYKKAIPGWQIKKLAYAAPIVLGLVFYYVVVFLNTWYYAHRGNIAFESASKIINMAQSGGAPFPIILGQNFGVLLYLIIAGAILFLYSLRKYNPVKAFGILVILISLSVHLNYGIRGFQFRFLWPLYLAMFFGILIYFIVSNVGRLVKINLTKYSGLISLFLFFLILIPNYSPLTHSGVMDAPHWEGFKWIEKNTPKNSTIMYFYGDVYYHLSVLYSGKRVSYLVNINELINGAQRGALFKKYLSSIQNHEQNFPYRISFFKFGHHVKYGEPQGFTKERSPCEADYVVLDKVGRYPALVQYNLALANNLIKNGAQVVFQNDVVLILKTPKGGVCVG